MFARIGGFTTRHPWMVCACWLLLGVCLSLVAPSWDRQAHDDDIHFLPDRCASVRGYRLLERAFPQEVFASRLILAIERHDRALSDSDLALVDVLVTDLAQLRQHHPDLDIHKICSQRDAFIGKRLLSEDGQCTLIQVSLGTPYLALRTRATVDRVEELVRDRLARAGTTDLPRVHVSGPAGVGRDLIAASGNSLDHTTVATVVLVVVILLAVYRAPLLALVPLFSIATAVWVALKLLALLTLIPGFYLINVSQIFAVVMLYGAGTDYCLFLVSRYREELASGKPGKVALAAAVGGVGGALAASAGTVVCGMALMGLAEFAKVRCGGPAIAISLSIALLASLTLTPALLRLFGKAVFWPVGSPRPTMGPQNRLWEWISHRVAAHPVRIGVAAALLLVPLALLGLRVTPTYRATAELTEGSSSVRGLRAIGRHFTPGELGPVTVLLEGGRSWDTPDGRHLVEGLTEGFSQLPNVAEVRSLTRPLGTAVEDPPPPPTVPAGKNPRGSLFTAVWKRAAQEVADKIQGQARAFYLAQHREESQERFVTRLDVVLKTDPFDPQSQETLVAMQRWLDEDLPSMGVDDSSLRAETYGVTVGAADLATITEGDRRRINLFVLGGILLILLILVRQPVLALYLLATVLLSYYATLGATTLLAHGLHGRPLGEIDWRVPFFLFTILVAVGEDYNIFLITRALEERRKHGGVEGTRRALTHTGGTITSCGLIMAGTFATLMLAGLNTLVQVGFALAFGVLLDTFVVRPLLVPAFTLWLWRRETRTSCEPVTHVPGSDFRAPSASKWAA